MGLIKKSYKLCIFLYIFWLMLTMNLQVPNLIIGLLISIIVTISSKGIIYDKGEFKIKIPNLLSIIRFTIRLMFEIYKSSFSYIMRIIKKDCSPVFVNVDLATKNMFIITIISNAITLTPGTLTIDTDKNRLVVLSIDDSKKRGDNLAAEIKEKYEKIFIKERMK